MPTQYKSLPISESLEAILIAINKYQYLTAGQVSRLLYPALHDEDRYAQRNLKKLEDAGYLLRLRALTKPRQGSEPHVFTLARRGRQYLSQLGIETPGYFRPSEEPDKAWRPFMKHTLAAIDVLIAAELLAK
jgi:Replication-relaxation